MALRRSWRGCEVVGAARHPETLRRALERGAVDRTAASNAEAVEGAETVVVCAPLEATEEVLAEIAPHLGPGTVVTDVGSVKASVVAAAERLVPPHARFVGAHPMAGSEKEGIEAADLRLFDGAVVVVTPTPRTDPAALEEVRRTWRAAGAIVVQMSPEEHDRLVAAISHLPHLVSSALVNAVGDAAAADPRTLELAAGGFRDTTRIASAPSALWRSIFASNAPAVREVLALFRRRLDELEAALTDPPRLEAALEAARRIRGRVPAVSRGVLPSARDLFVEIADRPGALAEITKVLADVGVNILDLEVRRVRDGAEGPIRLVVAGDAERDRALGALSARGLKARAG